MGKKLKIIFAFILGVFGGTSLVYYLEHHPNTKFSKFIMRILK